MNPVPSLGEFVERCLKNDREEMESLESREALAKDYFSGKQLKGIRVGAKVDARDANYIWCEGTHVLSKGWSRESSLRWRRTLSLQEWPSW
jgi:hypothetical protein